MAANRSAASSPESYSRSLWWNQTEEPQTRYAPLQGMAEADVAIIGGGFTGLSSALHLAEKGQKVIVLEARHIGFGASGRNGGQVIPGLKHDPDDLRAAYGPERGAEMIRLVGNAANEVFDLIARHQIRCTPRHGGWIQAAHSELAKRAVLRRAQQWQAEGVPVEILDRDGVAERSGTSRYFGGWRDPRAGSLQPLDYARGLARAAQAAGAVICEGSAATELKPQGRGWKVRTSAGQVTAKSVLVATNGYTGNLVPGLAQSILPVQSMILTTEVLPEALQAKVMPNGVVLSETRKLAFYMRQTHDGRFMIGGRGAVGMTEKPALLEALRKGMLRLFPELETVKLDYHWSGHVALTMDGLPHLHEPAPSLNTIGGYNGRGVALATVFGRLYAEMIAEGRPLPYPVTPIPRLAWHAIRKPVMDMGIRWYWLKDSLGIASK